MKRPFIFALIMISFFSGHSQVEKTQLFDLSSVKVSEIKTNTIRSDFGPAMIGDSIYFSSYRDELIRKSDRELMSKEFYDLYKAGIDDSGNVTGNRHPLDEFITRFHDGPVSWCPKTGELFVTQSNYADPSVRYKAFRNENIKLRIVVAKKLNDRWTVVEEFPYNNAEYSVGHPAINESGDTLVFASDMPGGLGSTDLYLSVRKDGKWSTPANLGSRVNTSGKDEFPFITGNSFFEEYLIFASTAHNSQGGFDLFYTKLNGAMSEVFPFPEPVNSVNDDFAMSLPGNVEFGYMTSNRPGTGNDDIYKLTFNKYIRYLQEILVLDLKTWKPIPGAVVNFCNKKRGETHSDGLISFELERKSLCDVNASAFGYRDNHKIIQIGSPRQGTVMRDTIFLDMIVNEKIVLRNIYYDFDKWDILPESATELDRLVSLMKENPEMKVELSSHTDARGTEQYNLELSQRRAQSAVDYLISKGIDKLKIIGTGYGESQLIHKSSGGRELTPSQHRENRRTEIYIPGFLRGEPVRQKKGDYSDVKPDAIKGYISLKEYGADIESAANVDMKTADNMKFHLILGSFKDKLKAYEFVQKLNAEGYKSTLVGHSEPFRVGVGYNSSIESNKALENLKSKFKNGWILVN